MSDENERSDAMRGSQPFAWAVIDDDGVAFVDTSETEANRALDRATSGRFAHRNPRILPLYRSPMLTGTERDAIIVAAEQSEKAARGARKIPGPTASLIVQHASVLRGVAERLS